MTLVTDNATESTPPHTVQYAYDGRGIRVKRTEAPNPTGPSTRRYVYSPDLKLLTMSTLDQPSVWGTGRLAPQSVLPSTSDFIWFGDLPVAETTSGFGNRYTFTDHLGTPILQTDPSGSTAWQAEYEPYGNVPYAPNDHPWPHWDIQWLQTARAHFQIDVSVPTRTWFRDPAGVDRVRVEVKCCNN